MNNADKNVIAFFVGFFAPPLVIFFIFVTWIVDMFDFQDKEEIIDIKLDELD